MATIEQCKTSLRERLKTKQDVLDFAKVWGGHYIDGDGHEARFIETNISRFVDEAHSKNMLDKLGIQLGLPSDGEANRINLVSTNRRAWIAIGIAGTVLVVSVLVALFK